MSPEQLEKRQLMAVDVWSNSNINGGWVSIVGEAGDDVFVQKVVGDKLWVAENSSFIPGRRIEVGGIDSIDKILIFSGAKRSDSNVQPVGYPMSDVSKTTFVLSGPGADLFDYDFEDFVDFDGLFEGTLSYPQPGGEVTRWTFTNEKKSGSVTTYSDVIEISRSGEGTARIGQYYPTAIKVINAETDGAAAAVQVTWNVEQLPAAPTLDYVNWNFDDDLIDNYDDVPFAEERREEYNLKPSAPRTSTFVLPNAAGPGLNPIIPESFRGTLEMDGVVFQISTDGPDPVDPSKALQLRFRLGGKVADSVDDYSFIGDGTEGVTLDGNRWGIWRKDGHYARYVKGLLDPVGRKVTLTVVGSELADFAGGLIDEYLVGEMASKVQTSYPGPVTLSADYALRTSNGAPVSATVWAGHDITNALDVDLNTPGSQFSVDSTLYVNPGRTTGIRVLATDVNFNAPASTTKSVVVGRDPASSTDQLVALPGNDPSRDRAAAVAVLDVQGKVSKVVIPAGSGGAGYDPDDPPAVIFGLAATARVTSVGPEGVITEIEVVDGGDGFRPGIDDKDFALTLANGAGATAKAQVDRSTGRITGIAAVNKGTGYQVGDTITLKPSQSGIGAAAVVDPKTGRVVRIDLGVQPTVNITANVARVVSGGGAEIAFSLSQSSVDFDLADIVVIGGALSNFAGSGTRYSATFTPTVGFSGAATISVPAGAFADAAGNPSTAGMLSLGVISSSPTVSINPSVSPIWAGQTAQITFTLSAPSSNFAIDDIIVAGGALSGFNGSGKSYSATFTPTVGFRGPATISVPAGKFTDSGNNKNLAGSMPSIFIEDTAKPVGGYVAAPVVRIAEPIPAANAGGAVAKVSRYQDIDEQGDTLDVDGVERIDIPQSFGGYGYTNPPLVIIGRPSIPGGRQATARAILDHVGRVARIEMIDKGTGYEADNPPQVTIAAASTVAVTEAVAFNALIRDAISYDIRTSDDPLTQRTRTLVYVSPSGSLLTAKDVEGVLDPSTEVFVQSQHGDVIVAGGISASKQTYLLQSDSQHEFLAPFQFSTAATGSGVQTGLISGDAVAVTLANDLDTPLQGAVAFSDVALRTEINSFRIRAARRTGEDVVNPFPYTLDIDEVDDISIDAVAASSFPIRLFANGDMAFNAALATAGGMIIDGVNELSVTAPVSTTKGQIVVTADSIRVENSLQVTDVSPDENHEDILLTARKGDIILNGDAVSAVNRVSLNQTNRLGGERGFAAVSNGGVQIAGDSPPAQLKIGIAQDFRFDDLKVRVNLRHPTNRDLSATLIAPNGVRYRLFTRGDASGANLINTLFTVSTGDFIFNGKPPYASSYRPVDSFAPLLRRPTAAGDWTLEVDDEVGVNDNQGVLTGFSLFFNDPDLLIPGVISGSAIVIADSLRIEAEGSVGDPALLPGDGTFFLRTNVNTIEADVDGAVAIDEAGDVNVVFLRAGGLVSLRAQGVDPEPNLGRAALRALLTDVKQLDVSAPNGSIDVEVNTPGQIVVGNAKALGLSKVARSGKVFGMQAAGDVSIKSQGGITGGEIVLLDGPIAGSSAAQVRFATIEPLDKSTYKEGIPGFYSSRLESTILGPLSEMLVKPQSGGLYSATFTRSQGAGVIADNKPNSPAVVPLIIEVNPETGAPQAISDISVTLDITHGSLRDLSATLVAPDGTKIPLFSRQQLRGKNLSGVTFDHESAGAVTKASAPYSGTFRPVGSLAALYGKNPAGVWRVEVADSFRGNTGTINRVDLRISTNPTSAPQLRVGDRILVAHGMLRDEFGRNATFKANGIYTVKDPGSPTTTWKLERVPEADTGADLPSGSFVAVAEGGYQGKAFQIVHEVKPEYPFGFSEIEALPISLSTKIDSSDQRDSLVFVVSTPDGTNSDPGSLGKMIALRQANEPSGTSMPVDFRFSTGITSPIQLTQELPAIEKAFAIDGARTFRPAGGPATMKQVFIDGSRITTTRRNLPVGPSTVVNGVEFTSSADGAKLAKVAIGGFRKGAAIVIDGARDVEINAVTLGIDPTASNVRAGNQNGVVVRSAEVLPYGADGRISFSTGVNPRWVFSSARANFLNDQSLINQYLNIFDGTEYVRYQVTKWVSQTSLELAAIGGGAALINQSVDRQYYFGGRNAIITNSEIYASGERGVSVEGPGARAEMFGNKIGSRLVGNKYGVVIETAGNGNLIGKAGESRNIVAYNYDGIVLKSGQSRVVNTTVESSTFDGIRIENGNHSIGDAKVRSSTSNIIVGNGRWGVKVEAAAHRLTQIMGNYIGVLPGSTGSAANGGGAIGAMDGDRNLAKKFDWEPMGAAVIDGNGNQHKVVRPAPRRRGWLA
jgi:subtilisin-like proprotein convertase family protein